MSIILTTFFLGVLGLFLGSFAGATVWRLRVRELKYAHKDGEKVSKAEDKQVSKIQKKSVLNDRSVCLHCGHQLRWYDLVPLISWLELGGKCRYCHKSIGKFELFIELGTAAFFVASFLFWPLPIGTPFEIAHFVIWLLAGLGLIILFSYDAKWYLLPNPIVFAVIGLGLINTGLLYAESNYSFFIILNALYACGILSGVYYLIYVVSKHQWVGFGDVKLGLALALLLADWKLAAIALFMANLIGTLIFLPFMLVGKVKRQAHIAFGPLLIAGWFVSGLFGAHILGWYLHVALGVS